MYTLATVEGERMEADHQRQGPVEKNNIALHRSILQLRSCFTLKWIGLLPIDL